MSVWFHVYLLIFLGLRLIPLSLPVSVSTSVSNISITISISISVPVHLSFYLLFVYLYSHVFSTHMYHRRSQQEALHALKDQRQSKLLEPSNGPLAVTAEATVGNRG